MEHDAYPQEQLRIQMALVENPVGAFPRTRYHSGEFPHGDALLIESFLYQFSYVHGTGWLSALYVPTQKVWSRFASTVWGSGWTLRMDIDVTPHSTDIPNCLTGSQGYLDRAECSGRYPSQNLPDFIQGQRENTFAMLNETRSLYCKYSL